MTHLPPNPGDRVRHTLLGVGTLIKFYDRGRGDERAVIDFDNHGEKELLWAFAHTKVELEGK